MLRRLVFNFGKLSREIRTLCIAGDKDGDENQNNKAKKGPSNRDIIGDDLLKAVADVADDLHDKGSELNKSAKTTLINRLISHEKATFDSAAASASSEMLDDGALLGLLADVATEDKSGKKLPQRAAQARQERRGLVLLRKEIFYQAIQSGYKSDEARSLSEKVVEQAQQRLKEQRSSSLKDHREGLEKDEEEKVKRDAREQKLFDLALQMIEKIYQDDLTTSGARKVVDADPNAPRLLGGSQTLGIWKSMEGSRDHSLGFWTEWDRRAALLTNKSFGSANSFEEQIEWTERGKQWPFPIDNEYLMGTEQNVTFIEHVFLERHLPALGIPKNGPIAHFMHLVCVGLSKNPYMTAAKKREHIQWFADYFSSEKQTLIEKLHKQEQIAAQSA